MVSAYDMFSKHKYLIVNFSHRGFFLIAPFPDHCLLIPFYYSLSVSLYFRFYATRSCSLHCLQKEIVNAVEDEKLNSFKTIHSVITPDSYS